MSDLEAQIEKWRAEFDRTGINAREVVDELEGHLREDVEKHRQSGLDDAKAFEAAAKGIGHAHALRREFNKLDMKNWNRKLAFAAWAMYVISFFLPSYGSGAGWCCALLQRDFWAGAMHGEWGPINYELLTLANLLMLASPLLLFRFGSRPRVMNWFRGLSLIAVLLVWAFLGLLFANTGDRGAMKIGCYVWGLSFVVLLVSLLAQPVQKRFARKQQHV